MEAKRPIDTVKYLLFFLLTLSINIYAVETQQANNLDQKAYLYSVKTISQSSDYYVGWPTATKSKDGELLLVYSGGRDWHICPFARVELKRSFDNGQTWSDAQVLIDSILDDRDSSICQTSKGTLLISWFTSTAWIDRLEKVEESQDEGQWYSRLKNEASNSQFRSKYEWPQEKIELWQKMRQKIKAEDYNYQSIKNHVKNTFRKTGRASVDQWIIRSEDNGKTWSEPSLIPLMSPHSPVVTSKGRLLLPGKTKGFVGLCESTDDGKTWNLVSKIQPMKGHDTKNYHELHIVEAIDDTLIVHIRNHDKPYYYETLQTESKDGGKSWTEPHSIGVWGHPSHLLRLKDNKLLMSYSYRGSLRKPKDSNRIESRISMDNGNTWSEPIILADNLHSWDFGYPTTVELGNNKLLTIWYEEQPDSPNAVIRQAIWEIVKY